MNSFKVSFFFFPFGHLGGVLEGNFGAGSELDH